MNRLLSALALLVPAAALADRYVYFQPHHPVPPAFGGGICHEEGVHPHEYVPTGLDLYRVSGGVHLYLGPLADPALTEVRYHGSHPLPDWLGGGICPLNGSHSHWWEPEGRRFRQRRGAWIYTGRLPARIHRAPPRPPRAHVRPTRRTRSSPASSRPHYKAVYERRHERPVFRRVRVPVPPPRPPPRKRPAN